MDHPISVRHLLIKPAATLQLPEGEPLSNAYLQPLQALSENTQLSYHRPMAMGMHVLALEPALDQAAAEQLAQQLSLRDEIDFVEPDYPRQRRLR